jgi:tetratricopeptide (TPR) repeat protein
VPPSDLRYATAMTAYARGVAHAAKGDAESARAAIDTVRSIQSATADPLNAQVLDIAAHALMGEVAFRARDLAGAEAHFRQAMAIEDELLYIEPPHWYYPIRHSLGAVLMEAGQAAAAEQVYREDLRRFPENTWSLHGLAASLRAQGRTGDADDVAARLVPLGGDVQLTASRF